MDSMAKYQKAELPAEPEELIKFVLFAQEKIKSLKAEIRAIEKLELAQEVYTQKMEEQDRLLELILAASQKVGEFTKGLATAKGKRNDVRPPPSSGPKFDSSKADRETKTETIQKLGLSTSQVYRFEKLAEHPDIVETVIADSRAGKTTATQKEVLRRIKEGTNVIDMIAARKDRFNRDMAQIDADAKTAKAFVHAVHAPLTIAEDPAEIAAAVWRNASGKVQGDIADIDAAVAMLTAIKMDLLRGGDSYGRI